jgi:hypothetical protein
MTYPPDYEISDFPEKELYNTQYWIKNPQTPAHIKNTSNFARTASFEQNTTNETKISNLDKKTRAYTS